MHQRGRGVFMRLVGMCPQENMWEGGVFCWLIAKFAGARADELLRLNTNTKKSRTLKIIFEKFVSRIVCISKIHPTHGARI